MLLFHMLLYFHDLIYLFIMLFLLLETNVESAYQIIFEEWA